MAKCFFGTDRAAANIREAVVIEKSALTSFYNIINAVRESFAGYSLFMRAVSAFT